MALRLLARLWSSTTVLVKCDNDAVVKVLNAGKARDPFLGACTRNIWYLAAIADVNLQYVHVMGKNNTVGDLLSRWQYSEKMLLNYSSLSRTPYGCQ